MHASINTDNCNSSCLSLEWAASGLSGLTRTLVWNCNVCAIVQKKTYCKISHHVHVSNCHGCFFSAAAHGGAFCCDATLVSPLPRMGHPQPCTAARDGAALQVANAWHTPSSREAAEVGRWSAGAHFVRDLVRLHALRAPPGVRAAASTGWSRRWWGTLSVAGCPATRAERGPFLGPCSRPRRTRGAQLSPKPGPRVAAGEINHSSGIRGLRTISCRHKSPRKKSSKTARQSKAR